MECDGCQVADPDELILKTPFWKVTLAGGQAYLGRSYITLMRHCGSLADLRSEEWEDLKLIINQLESALKNSFDATLFNWTCLMNQAYQNTPPNPHIHWHFRPRYSRSLMVNSEEFSDPEFGHHYNSKREQIVSPELFGTIISRIRSHLSVNLTK